MTTAAARLESEYRKLRNQLLEAEIALKDQRESVAALRRQLPMGPAVRTDYVFREGPADILDEAPGQFKDVRLSDLFAPGKNRLIVDHMMWGATDMSACPMCTMWADAYNAVAPHVSQKANFVLVAKVEIGEFPGGGDGAKSGCCRAASLVSMRISRSKVTEDNILASACSAANLMAKSIIFTRPKPRFTPGQRANETTGV